jgi:hypothetical protein
MFIIIAKFVVADKRHSKAAHHRQSREAYNKYDLTDWLMLSVSNLRIIMIGPGGLFAISSSTTTTTPHLFASIWWVGLQKSI